MKIHIILVLLISAEYFAQSPAVIKNLYQKEPAPYLKNVSPSNVWVGSQLAYNFSGDGEFEDKFGVTGRVVLNTFDWSQPSNIHFPIIGNISQLKVGELKEIVSANAQTLLNSFQGINIGFYPYVLWGNPRSWSATLWGSFLYKLNSVKDTTSQLHRISQLRYGTGIETSIGGAQLSTLPIVISVNLVWSSITSTEAYQIIFPKAETNWFTTEFTFVVPLANNIGVMGKSEISHKTTPIWSGGVIFSQGL